MGGTVSSSIGRPPGCDNLFGCLFCARASRFVGGSRRRTTRSVDEFATAVNFDGVSVLFDYFGDDLSIRRTSASSVLALPLLEEVHCPDLMALEDQKRNEQEIGQTEVEVDEGNLLAGAIYEHPDEQELKPVEQTEVEEDSFDVMVLQELEQGVQAEFEQEDVIVQELGKGVQTRFEQEDVIAQEVEDVDVIALEVQNHDEQLLETMVQTEIQEVCTYDTDPVILEVCEVTPVGLSQSAMMMQESGVDVVGLSDDDTMSVISVVSEVEDDLTSCLEQASSLEGSLSSKKQDDQQTEAYMLPLPFVKKSSQSANSTMVKKPNPVLSSLSSSLPLRSNSGLVLPHSLLASSNKIKPFNNPHNNLRGMPVTGSMINVLMSMKKDTDSGRSPSPFINKRDSSNNRSSPSPFSRTSVSPFLSFIPDAQDES